MTREEAIKNIKEHCYFADLIPRAKEALDMAVRALEQEPCDEYGNYKYPSDIELSEPNTATSMPCWDAISRADAEALFRNARSKLNPSDYKTADEFNTRDLMLLNAEQFIHLLSSVNPQPKTGQWILLDECANSGYYCSKCHKKVVKEGWSNTVKKIKYCPNCGAKME